MKAKSVILKGIILAAAKKKLNGFSRLEVFVVLILLLFLTCTFLVASEEGRAHAKAIVCQNRLGQLSRALLTYVADYDGYIMPYSTKYPKNATPNSMPWVCPHGDIYPDLDWDEEYWYGILYAAGYVHDKNMFFCPDFLPDSWKAHEEIKPFEGPMNFTFGMRDWCNPNDGIRNGIWINNRAPKPLDVITHPDDFFLMTDTFFFDRQKYQKADSNCGQFFVAYDRGRSGANGWTTGIHVRHDNQANAMFADGHVDSKPLQYWIDLQDPDPSHCWQQSYTLSQIGYRVFDKQMQEWMRDPMTGQPIISRR